MHKKKENVEEYLEAIYRMEEKGLAASVVRLARELRVSKPSVSQMVGKLQRLGWVAHTSYGPIRLTKKGQAQGKRIVRKHRLIEKFLAFLGLKRRLHSEACLLEHSVSDNVEQKMADALRKAEGERLWRMERGEEAKIVKIDAEPALARRLEALGLTTGTRITIFQQTPFKGAIEIIVRGTRLAIGKRIALKITARKVR